MSEWFSLLWDTFIALGVSVVLVAVFIFGLVIVFEGELWKKILGGAILFWLFVAFLNTLAWSLRY